MLLPLFSLRRFVVSLVLVIAGLSAMAVDEAALERRFQEANAQLDAGKFQEALEAYNAILEAKPDASNVWVTRAIARWNLNDRSGARADLAHIIRMQPDNFDAYRIRGQFRYQAEDYTGSLEDFNRAIELMAHIAPAELFGMRGEVRRKLEQPDAAIRDLDRAIELKPDYVSALYVRGELHDAAGRAAEAEADYSRTIELAPEHADALNNRAWIRFHARRWDAAIADGQAALRLAPKAAIALRVVGYSQFATGDYAAAAKTLGDAYEAEPTADSSFALFIRHVALQRGGASDQRLATSSVAWKDQPWLTAIARFLTGALEEDGLEAAAKDTTDDGELAGRACEMHFYIGLKRLLAGDKSTARLRFRSALQTEQKTYIEYTLAEAELARK